MIRDGIIKREAKKLPKRFYDEVEAELETRAFMRRIGLAEEPTDNHDAIRIKHLE